MTDVTRILSEIEHGDPSAADELLPLVYEELRRLAAARLNSERPGQTLQATALVHEAYVRLVNVREMQHWNCRGHFFAAAAEAMRRILVEQARRKKSLKAGGGLNQVGLSDVDLPKNAWEKRLGTEHLSMLALMTGWLLLAGSFEGSPDRFRG